ncbi:hypothetical protein CVD28_00405 [Bacillus sp. M6-12]|uniref:hypothetical protein n=1 Tax=Bacillus sp. M6-12 TaxID=2054166 RepID=UPI000C77A6A3|nr:hypothetical protein [Bacillus sp. M6-12]PLS18896.1 hypothetical protein CVD28_00405 [Bacillus sp. M6-12]
MEKAKALIITDVIKEPRTFEITSEQMGLMGNDQHFELDVKDMEGIGTFYPLLTTNHASTEAIDHAISKGAKWETVWVEREMDILREFQFGCCRRRPENEEEAFMETAFTNFFDTCQHFCLVGDCKEQSYMKLHVYDTVTAIFISQEDFIAFKRLIEVLQLPVELNDKKEKVQTLLKDRPKVELNESRFQWEHLM